jgi:hypothetical protein
MVAPDEFVPTTTATTVPSLRAVTPLRLPESGTGKVTMLQFVPFQSSIVLAFIGVFSPLKRCAARRAAVPHSPGLWDIGPFARRRMPRRRESSRRSCTRGARLPRTFDPQGRRAYNDFQFAPRERSRCGCGMSGVAGRVHRSSIHQLTRQPQVSRTRV